MWLMRLCFDWIEDYQNKEGVKVANVIHNLRKDEKSRKAEKRRAGACSV